jgi:protein-S-isoprenylcysteine O-methyltransferase Ste14
MRRITVVLYGTIAYAIFLATFLYAFGFVGNFWVPRSIDNGNPGSGIPAVLINLSLLSVFAFQHSIMARPAFKKWWLTIVPKEIERSTYVLLSSLALLLLFWKWNAMTGIIWNADNAPVRYGLTALYFAGWIIVLLSTFMINHFDLFGLRQVFYYFRNRPAGETSFKTNWLYRIIRHPIMFGFLVAFWATPVMTVGHLLFAVTTTAYILMAIKFLEERDLAKSLGEPYRKYQRNVPMLIPFTKGRKATRTLSLILVMGWAYLQANEGAIADGRVQRTFKEQLPGVPSFTWNIADEYTRATFKALYHTVTAFMAFESLHNLSAHSMDYRHRTH